jgi:hypothetical protein
VIEIGGHETSRYRRAGHSRLALVLAQGRLVLSWLEEDADWIHPARLVISLTATDAGTTVTLTHDGFALPRGRSARKARGIG